MKIVLLIVGILIGIGIEATYASFMKRAAIQKGYGDDAHAWALCFWLGIIGGLYVIALPDLICQNQNQQIIELLKEKRNNE